MSDSRSWLQQEIHVLRRQNDEFSVQLAAFATELANLRERIEGKTGHGRGRRQPAGGSHLRHDSAAPSRE